MGFYSTDNLAKFKIENTLKTITQTKTNPLVIYASFELTESGEFKINPINPYLQYGYFLVTQPTENMSIQFVGNTKLVKKVLGMISFGYPYSVEQISPTTFQFNLNDLPTPTPFFGTLSIILYKY